MEGKDVEMRGRSKGKEAAGSVSLRKVDEAKSAPQLCSPTACNYSALSCCCLVNLSGFSRTNLLHMENLRVESLCGDGGGGGVGGVGRGVKYCRKGERRGVDGIGERDKIKRRIWKR